MCIMEVRKGQHHSTIQQACAHNVGTVVGDLTLFKQLLRDHPEKLVEVEALQADLNRTYDRMVELYGDFVADELSHSHEGDPLVNAGVNEAMRLAHADIHNARKYETR